MKEVYKSLLEDKIREILLENVVALPWHEAVRQGFVHMHALRPDFRAEFLIPEVRHLPVRDETAYILGLVHALKSASAQAVELGIPHYSTDIGLPCLRLYGKLRLARILRQLFSLWSEEPRCRVSLNFGDEMDDDAIGVVETTLQVLDAGATFLEPQVVVRVRRGVNLERESRGFKVLYKALDMARTRGGISFALMDSPLNAAFMGLLGFTRQGLRLEPTVLDFYQGTRGQSIGGKVSVNVPRALSFGLATLQEAMDVAARLLATALELTDVGSADRQKETPLVINLSGLATYPVSHELFDLLGFLGERVTKLRQDLGLNFVLAATGEDVSFGEVSVPAVRQHKISALVANMEQHLSGGHCLWLNSGPHLSAEDLYSQLLEASEKGISFMRFSPEDVRCTSCHLVVAALGACPRCGSEGRRRITDRGTGLRELPSEPSM